MLASAGSWSVDHVVETNGAVLWFDRHGGDEIAVGEDLHRRHVDAPGGLHPQRHLGRLRARLRELSRPGAGDLDVGERPGTEHRPTCRQPLPTTCSGVTRAGSSVGTRT